MFSCASQETSRSLFIGTEVGDPALSDDPKPGDILLDNDPYRLKICRHGPMLFLFTDRYVGRSLDLYGEYSEAEIALFRQILKPEQVVLEVGANMGAHTVFLANAVGPNGAVHALEPQRLLFQVLNANLALNSLSNVWAYNVAAGRNPGRAGVPRLDYSMAGNFGGLTVGDDSPGEQVPLTPLDTLDLSGCDFIKIDVEGMEAEVIAGAGETIGHFRPLLYVENDRRKRSRDLIRQMFDLDYRLYWHLPRLFNPENFLANRENVFEGIVSINMLCVPRERRLTMTRFREILRPEDDWPLPG